MEAKPLLADAARRLAVEHEQALEMLASAEEQQERERGVSATGVRANPALVRQAYQTLKAESVPAGYAALLRAARTRHDGFDLADLRTVIRQEVGDTVCLLAITGSDPTAGQAPHGVYATLALGRDRNGKLTFTSRGDAVSAAVAADRFTELVVAAGGKPPTISAGEVEKLVRRMLAGAE